MNRWTPAFTFIVGLLLGFVLADNPASTTPVPRPKKINHVFVIATSLNVREQPSTSAKVFMTLHRGDSVRVIRTQGKWSQVHARKGTAWVFTRFVGSKRDVQRAVEKVKKQEEEQKKAAEKKQYDKERAEAKRQKKLKEEAYEQKQTDRRVALYKQWAEQIEYGCRSRAAVFRKTWLVGWQLTLTTYPNAHAEPIEVIFPDDHNKVKRTLEKIGAGDPVLYATYLAYIGACE